jgi:hypothetical protein
MGKLLKSFFLSPFAWGIGSVLDLRGTPVRRYRRPPPPPRVSDAEALRRDWEKVGQAIRSAMEAESHARK